MQAVDTRPILKVGVGTRLTQHKLQNCFEQRRLSVTTVCLTLPLTTPIATPLQLSTVTASPLQPSKEDRKRSQLATQLFGELSGPSRVPRSKTQSRSSVGGGGVASRTTAARPQERQQKKSKEPQVDLLLDLQVSVSIQLIRLKSIRVHLVLSFCTGHTLMNFKYHSVPLLTVTSKNL